MGLPDWAPGQFKGECGEADAVTGLSALPGTLQPHSILCGYNGNINSKPYNGSWSIGLNISGGNQLRSYTWDWDFGYYKAECADDEAVTGVAQNASGQITYVLCSRAYQQAVAGACVRRVFSGGNSQGNNTGGPDWAYGFYKGQCDNTGFNSVVKGVSRHPTTGRAHAILCCPVASTAE